MTNHLPRLPRMPRLIAGGALALLLAGCVSFGEKPPPTLMTLDAATPVQANAGTVVPENSAVTIFAPTVAQELASARVPVRTAGAQIAYLKAARWIDVPARLFRNLLADTVATRTGRAVLEPRDYHLSPGPRLSGKLSEFGIEAGTNMAVVGFDALLQRDGKALETRHFEAKAPVSRIDTSGARNGLNSAANDVAVQVADWIGRP